MENVKVAAHYTLGLSLILEKARGGECGVKRLLCSEYRTLNQSGTRDYII
jgi:hypothetical protein